MTPMLRVAIARTQRLGGLIGTHSPLAGPPIAGVDFGEAPSHLHSLQLNMRVRQHTEDRTRPLRKRARTLRKYVR